jgi:hypothetical protein
MMVTIWILAVMSIVVWMKMTIIIFINDNATRFGWLVYAGATSVMGVTLGVLYVGGWPEYAAQWIGS